MAVATSHEEAIDLDQLVPRDVRVSIRVEDLPCGVDGIGPCIGQVFIFCMGEDVAQEVVEKAGQVVAQINSPAIDARFVTDILRVFLIPEVVFIVKILVDGPDSDVQLVDGTDAQFRGDGDAGDATELKSQVAAY